MPVIIMDTVKLKARADPDGERRIPYWVQVIRSILDFFNMLTIDIKRNPCYHRWLYLLLSTTGRKNQT